MFRIPSGPVPVLILALTLAGAAQAGPVYRYVDEQGRVHYTDRPPHPDAQPLALPEVPTFRGDLDLPPRGRSQPSAPSQVPYQLSIISPADGATLRDPAEVMAVSVRLQPELQDGHGLIYYHNGERVNATPVRQLSVQVSPVYRGEHSFAVAVVDEAGREQRRSAPITVYKHPPRAGGLP